MQNMQWSERRHEQERLEIMPILKSEGVGLLHPQSNALPDCATARNRSPHCKGLPLFCVASILLGIAAQFQLKRYYTEGTLYF
jgi:hypothetical protein